MKLTANNADHANDSQTTDPFAQLASFAVESPSETLAVMESSGLLFAEESYKILGACFAVYNELGCGFLEAVYHEALSIEFQERAVPFISRWPLELTYRGRQLKQGYAPDFALYGKIILEIKAHTALCDEHWAQTMNYLRASGFQLGLLVNFGKYPKLEYQRIANTLGRYRQ